MFLNEKKEVYLLVYEYGNMSIVHYIASQYIRFYITDDVVDV